MPSESVPTRHREWLARADARLTRTFDAYKASPTFANRSSWDMAFDEYQRAKALAEAEERAYGPAEPESPPAPTVTGRTPATCSAKGHGCNSNPCFGCPNA